MTWQRVYRVITTSVTYVLVSAVLLALFAAASLLGNLAIGSSRPAVAMATAVCALALQPVRRRTTAWVNGRFYPLRQGALAALDDVRARVSNGDAEPEELEGVLRTALHDPDLRVGYRVPGDEGYVDARGVAVAATRPEIPVTSGGSTVGALWPGRPIPTALGRDVAGAAAVLVGLVSLRLQLARALEQAAAGRARLLQSSYAERRRLERDIHDGAQQRLVALGMSLRLAQRHLDDESIDLEGLLDETIVELSTAVAELRQIAHGLRPSHLDDGLEPALTVLARTLPVPVNVDVRVAELDDSVATTAYYVAAEAVTNALKHAHASSISLSVERENGHLAVHVQDDGRGGAVVRPGSGLAGLSDRVTALGGFLSVTSPTQGGTVVRAVLPCQA